MIMLRYLLEKVKLTFKKVRFTFQKVSFTFLKMSSFFQFMGLALKLPDSVDEGTGEGVVKDLFILQPL